MAEALHTVHVNLAADSLERSYPIEIGRGLLTDTETKHPCALARID